VSPVNDDLDPQKVRQSWMDRRREKVIAEVQRNRRGEYKVPTWVLALMLVLFLAGWAALIFTA